MRLWDGLGNGRALRREEMDFLVGAIEQALEAAFLTADLVEGFEIGDIGGRAGQSVLAMKGLVGELFFDGCELLLRANGEEAEFEFDDAVETPGGVLYGEDEFAFDIGLGLPGFLEMEAEGVVNGLVFIGQDDGAGEEAGFEGIEFDAFFAFRSAGAGRELGVDRVSGCGHIGCSLAFRVGGVGRGISGLSG